MKINRVIIFSNGLLDPLFLQEIKSTDFIIGADRAAFWLLQHHIIPDLAVGDFDSTTQKELSLVKKESKKIILFSSKKDFTDTELAINQAIKLKPKKVVIYGATGTRLDHSLANIFLLEKLSKYNIISSIKDLYNEIFLVKDTFKLKNNKNFPFISILPLTNSITISLSGFVYNLNHQKIIQGQSLGVSNEVIKKISRIVIHQGKAIVIKSHD
jgi:thiamine pyrophosphokinase